MNGAAWGADDGLEGGRARIAWTRHACLPDTVRAQSPGTMESRPGTVILTREGEGTRSCQHQVLYDIVTELSEGGSIRVQVSTRGIPHVVRR